MHFSLRLRSRRACSLGIVLGKVAQNAYIYRLATEGDSCLWCERRKKNGEKTKDQKEKKGQAADRFAQSAASDYSGGGGTVAAFFTSGEKTGIGGGACG